MNKRILALCLVMVLLFSLAACSGGGNSNPTTFTDLPTTDEPIESGTAPVLSESAGTEAPAESTEDIGLSYGSVADGAYTNTFVGIGCALDDTWTVATEEELAQLNGLVADTISDENFSEMIKQNGNVVGFYALRNDGASLNLSIEDIGPLASIIVDEYTYCDIAMNSVETALNSSGYSNITIETVTVQLAGEAHAALSITGEYGGLPVYEKVVAIKCGDYIACLTVACFNEDITGDLLALFYALD